MLGDTISTMEYNIEVKGPDTELLSACLLIMAAATLLSKEHPAVSEELQYIAKSLSHPLLVLKQESK